MGPQTYEITFAGQAGSALRAEFDDCNVIIGSGTTTLRAELPDQGALWGIVQRIIGLGLEVIHMHLIAPPPSSGGTREDSDQSGIAGRPAQTLYDIVIDGFAILLLAQEHA